MLTLSSRFQVIFECGRQHRFMHGLHQEKSTPQEPLVQWSVDRCEMTEDTGSEDQSMFRQ
jgi:hypothetical protein